MKLLRILQWLGVALWMGLSVESAAQTVIRMSDYGVKPNLKRNSAPLVKKAIQKIQASYQKGDSLVLLFEKGTYLFYPKGASEREYYISNHDQDHPKRVGLALEDFHRLTVDGQEALFLFHGRMLPLSLVCSSNCTLRNLSVDFVDPQIAQIRIVENTEEGGMVFEPAPWVNYTLTPDSLLEWRGYDWKLKYGWGMAFEEKTRHIVYNTSNLPCPIKQVVPVGKNRFQVRSWKDGRLKPGTAVTLRGWDRPNPGIFLSHNRNIKLENVTVHYAEGMGLIAQLCENISLNRFNVCLKGADDPRYFTTQADATHFSGCKGRIVVRNGLYECMMDDAINVHGTYLKLVKRLDDYTLVGRYMHRQSWGFDWGFAGDSVQVIRSNTMEKVGDTNTIVSIQPYGQERVQGAKEFVIRFQEPIAREIDVHEKFGLENLTWTPEVVFVNNVVRNNRARGALFSTPRLTRVEENVFDHTSGAAILLCGDCNGWYETGSCRDVVIRHNHFYNALTSVYQFTNAVISINPVIPNLAQQVQYFHGGGKLGICIEENVFDTFDHPIVYAKSVDGLTFKHNLIRTNQEYAPFHPNASRFWLERVTNTHIADPEVAASANDSVQVLFLGNSYTYQHDLPHLLHQLAASCGKKVAVKKVTKGGWYLKQHAVSPRTRHALLSQPWHYVVLQEQSLAPTKDSLFVAENIVPAVQTLDSLRTLSSPQGKTVFYLTWGRNTAAYEEQQQKLEATYGRLAESTQGLCAPVGRAWRVVRQERPDIDLYLPDRSHPSIHGSYLAACVFYATFFGEPFESDFDAGLNKEVATYLQKVAQRVVFNR